MSKAVLVMDMPKYCIDCPCHFAGMHTVKCGVKKKRLPKNDIETYKPDWCPLKPMPEKANHPDWCDGGRYDKGYNACIDELLKEK